MVMLNKVFRPQVLQALRMVGRFLPNQTVDNNHGTQEVGYGCVPDFHCG
jgi:hypothetical protein